MRFLRLKSQFGSRLKVLLYFVFISLVVVMLKLYSISDSVKEPLEGDSLNQSEQTNYCGNIAVVVMSCNRVEVERCMKSLMSNNNFTNPAFTFIVSQGCDDENTKRTILKYGNHFKYVRTFHEEPDSTLSGIKKRYSRISLHYRAVLHFVFDQQDFKHVIFVEDDLETSEDFLSYFLRFRPLLEEDVSLMCLSAWNDNGYSEYAIDNKNFLHTQFFPGLGWMMSRRLWDELGPDWPKIYWDDWLRESSVSKGRSCIYPEVPRVLNFGQTGVSRGLFYETFVKRVIVNKFQVSYDDVPLSRYNSTEYLTSFFKQFYSAVSVSYDEYLKYKEKSGAAFRIPYQFGSSFKEICRGFGITSQVIDGMARTSYKGVITLNVLGNHRVYLYKNDNVTVS